MSVECTIKMICKECKKAGSVSFQLQPEVNFPCIEYYSVCGPCGKKVEFTSLQFDPPCKLEGKKYDDEMGVVFSANFFFVFVIIVAVVYFKKKGKKGEATSIDFFFLMFNTTLLTTQPGRYALIAESILPPLGIFILGGLFLRPSTKAGEFVKGRPPGFVFGIIWFVLTAIWLLGLVIVALNTLDTLSLCLIGIFSFLSFLGCMLWLVVYKQGYKEMAAQVLLFAFGMMLVTTVVTVGSETPTDAKVVASLFFALITAWLTGATLFNYIEVNLVS